MVRRAYLGPVERYGEVPVRSHEQVSAPGNGTARLQQKSAISTGLIGARTGDRRPTGARRPTRGLVFHPFN
jgi:hypothetical protein